jgi:hypothetical protein
MSITKESALPQLFIVGKKMGYIRARCANPTSFERSRKSLQDLVLISIIE